MMKNKFSKIDVEVIYKKLDNGLDVYLVPMNDKHNIYATFSTKFGSIQVEFETEDGKQVNVPYGTAHFLEHKLFEQKNGVDPFTFYSKNGADANANTSYYKTTYLFSGNKKFEDNLEFLLDYVQDPYFTDENVSKEKGIIDQERKMYQDNPVWRMYEGSIFNLINTNPIKYPIVGTHESIYSITKEDLYDCYNAFYNPSNMFLVISGNFDADKTLKLIENNQNKKEFLKNKKIKPKKYIESRKVSKEFEEVKMDVNIDKFCLSYKIYTGNLNVETHLLLMYMLLFLDIKISPTSDLMEQLKDKKYIFDNVGFEYNSIDDYLLLSIYGESDKYNETINEIDSVINNKNISEKEFNRKKKCMLSNLIGTSGNIYSINSKIVSHVIKCGRVLYDEYDIINKLNIADLEKIINKLDFSEKSIFIINKKSL